MLERSEIDSILSAGLPNRFQNIDPQSFEDLIAQLFADNNYSVEPTNYTRDYGADLIVEKDRIRTAVQVKRYQASNLVGVSDLNQVLGAKEYYKCDAAMLITTSDYTKSSRQVSSQSNVIIWDWEKLRLAFEKTYCEGQSYIDYFGPAEFGETDLLEMDLVSIEIHPDSDSRLLLTVEITNTSTLNLQVFLEQPICLTKDNKQITSKEWDPNTFQSGTLFNQATVEVLFSFDSSQISQFHKNDRILILANILSTGQNVLLETEIGSIKKGCFITTYLFGLRSSEYQVLTNFRDQYLAKSALGLQFIGIYYRWSKYILKFPIRSRGSSSQLARLVCPVASLLIKYLGQFLKRR